jgi:L-asparaginase
MNWTRALLGAAAAFLCAVAGAAAQTAPAGKPLVKIVATGGTIANSPGGRMSIESVMQKVPELAAVAELEVVDYARIGSSSITVQNWVDIGNAVNKILREEPRVAGIVVTHGSNTSEETAYYLSLVVDSRKPVVVTAAQRQQNTLGEEGSRNLFDAVKVAAAPEAAGKGVLLVVNEMIHAARDVTKRISVRVETWDSGDLGALGLVDKDQVTFYRAPTYKQTTSSDLRLPNLTQAGQLPRVDIILSYADADGALIEAAVKAGAKGLVVAGFPTGSPTPAQRKALLAVQEAGTAVVMSHRGGLGRISTIDNPFITADNLTPQKARILLMLALAKAGANGAPSKDELKRIIQTH